jgi:hypothetical protein
MTPFHSPGRGGGREGGEGEGGETSGVFIHQDIDSYTGGLCRS